MLPSVIRKMTIRESEKNLVLLADGDAETARLVRTALGETQLDLVAVKSLADALDQLNSCRPRLILSELALPDGSGFSLCRHVRESSQIADVPVILVSQWSHESDRILAFECGADDFLAKPFFQRELASRIRAVLRRSAESIQSPQERENRLDRQLEIDEQRRVALLEGTEIVLTPREFALLAALARDEGRVLSRRELITDAWQAGENPTERSVDAHVKSLRRKLAGTMHAIETVRGLGYRYSDKTLARRRSSQ